MRTTALNMAVGIAIGPSGVALNIQLGRLLP
jgi:hypothetical protein